MLEKGAPGINEWNQSITTLVGWTFKIDIFQNELKYDGTVK